MKRRFDSGNMKRGVLRRILVLMLCVSMLAGTAGCLSGCTFINNITDGLSVTQKPVSEAELARLMVNAIASDSNVADCYAKIPDPQLNGLSYSIFSEYCSILRKCSQAHGTADSFKILSDTEKQDYFLSISSANEDYRSIDYYGDLDVVELCYSKDKDSEAPQVVFTISRNNGSYTLAGQYVIDTVLAYSYINHYFEMIDDRNVDGLEAIIKSAYNSDIYMPSVIHAKADYIASYYYRLKVKTNKSGYVLKSFSPIYISYVIPEVFSIDGNTISEDIAVGRLIYPYELDDSFRSMYENYAKANMKTILERLIKQTANNPEIIETIRSLANYKPELIQNDALEHALNLGANLGYTLVTAVLMENSNNEGITSEFRF